jgi:hypothetical protein
VDFISKPVLTGFLFGLGLWLWPRASFRVRPNTPSL